MKKTLSIILAILMIVTSVPMVALPASAALTPTATGGCNGNHSGYTQIQLNGGTTHRITKAGNYYINSSIYESTYSPALTIECSGTVTICLNGNDICHTGYGSRVVYLSTNGGELTVNLCDCKGTGEIYHEDGNTGIDFYSGGALTLNMYGGTIRDCDSGLSTWSNSTVNMYGGTIKNSTYYGIYQDSNNGKVNIYGGSIINNTEGIRVCSADSVTLTGSPVISGNTNGDLYYRRPNSAVIAKDLSVSSPITIGQDREAAGDYAVVKVDSADMLSSFKYINNTKKLFYDNNQIFVHGDSHSFKDATCVAPKTCTICGATEGVVDNTAHIWGEGVLTRPTKTEEGYYTYTCSSCDATKTEAAQRATNYAEYTKALNDLRAYLDSDKLTDDAKASVAEWLEIYDSDEAYKFIAGEEETVNLYIEVALQYAAEIEAAIQDCLAGNHSGNGEYCDVCGAILHTCDFTGEWQYDSEKHWKECTCGEISEEAVHTLTEGKCDVCEYLFYKIIHQPTAEQPYVELNDDTDAFYQWYTVDLNKNEVVNDGVIGNTNGSVYKGEIGWRPTWSADGSADFLEVNLKKGQMLTLVPSAYCGKLSIIKNGTYLTKADCQAGEELAYIAEADGLYNVFSENYTSGTSLRAYITDITYTLVDGETSARLQNPVVGEVYACEVTFRDGTKEMSDSFVSNHTCDFTGEWQYDSEKHWKECECGEIDEEAVHTLTEGKCDCGYECPHEDTYNNLIRPVQNADGTWGKGKVVEICNICGNSSLVQEVERDHEGYKVFDETAAELEAILNSGKMTDTWKNDYTNRLNGLRNSAYYQVYTEIETAIPSMTESLKSIIAAIEAGLADGTMRRADFTYMTALFDEINALIDNDPNKLIPSESGRFQGIYYGYYMSCKNNGNHSQADYDQNMADNNWEGQIEAILAGVKEGTALKADYTEINEAIVKLDEKLADENVTDEAKAELEEIKAELEEMKKNPLSSKADLSELEKTLEEYEAELDAGIEDGSALKADGIEILLEYQDELRENLIKKYGEENYNNLMNSTTDEVKEKAIAIEEAAEALTGTVAENAEKIAEIKASFKALFDEAELCLAGTHSYTYEEISPAKCGENAIEEGTCWFCGEVLTREVENSALTHSFTKYEETEAPKCGVAGKEVAYCDNGCGETDEKAIDALEHLFIDYIYNEDATCTADGTKTAVCDNGCGETDTVTAEDTMLEHVDEDGDKICDECETEIKDVCPDCGGPAHEETGVPQYICMLITLIKLVVSLVQALQSLQTVA